jgi:hypothetical protein
MNASHTAFDQRFEAGESVLDALELSAARRPHLDPKPEQERARSLGQQEPTSQAT